MRIQSEDGINFIDMQQQEVELRYYPGVSFRIEASAHGFSAAVNHVWFTVDALRQFCADLVQLEKRRQGVISIESMSPAEAILALESIDTIGHMIARLNFKAGVFLNSHSRRVEQHLSITFEIDVSLLPSLVRQFKQLIPSTP